MRVTFPKTDASQLIDFLGLSLSLSPYRENFFYCVLEFTTTTTTTTIAVHTVLARHLPRLHVSRKQPITTGKSAMWRLDGFGSCRYRLQRFSGRNSVSIIYRDWKKNSARRFCEMTETCAKSFLCPTVVYYMENFDGIVKRRLLRLRWIKRRFQYYTQLTTVYKYDKNGKRYKFYSNIYI